MHDLVCSTGSTVLNVMVEAYRMDNVMDLLMVYYLDLDSAKPLTSILESPKMKLEQYRALMQPKFNIVLSSTLQKNLNSIQKMAKADNEGLCLSLLLSLGPLSRNSNEIVATQLEAANAT